MENKGLYIVFEAPPKSGKTTLVGALATSLRQTLPNRTIVSNRGALSKSTFGKSIQTLSLMDDVAYSSSFFWADLIFDTQDFIVPALANGHIVVQDRYDLSIVTFRNLHGLVHDDILLKEYRHRGMIIDPDLTVLLDPGYETGLRRMLVGADTSKIDRDFYLLPENYDYLMSLYRRHLRQMNRNFLELDTKKLSIDECVQKITTTAFLGQGE